MKKTNNPKIKGEQLFQLFIAAMGCLIILCITGCGGNSCEKPRCNAKADDNLGKTIGIDSATKCSVPGCGGCLTSGKGCNSCLWSQSTKCGFANGEFLDGTADGIISCDTVYYAPGCMGCGSEEKHSYTACVTAESGNKFVYGNNEKAYYWGGSSCAVSGPSLREDLDRTDEYLGIK